MDPGSRHRGVARALMPHAESVLAARGARVIYVLVQEQNTPGLALVPSAGYEPEPGEFVFSRELLVPVPAQS